MSAPNMALSKLDAGKQLLLKALTTPEAGASDAVAESISKSPRNKDDAGAAPHQKAGLPDGVVAEKCFPKSDIRSFLLDEIETGRRLLKGVKKELRHEMKGTPEKHRLFREVSDLQLELGVLEDRLEANFVPQHSPKQLMSPQLLLMSKVFNVRSNRVAREPLVKFLLASTEEGDVWFAGPELRQADGLLFMALVNMARDVRLGKLVSFDPRRLCEFLYGNSCNATIFRQQESIYRLQHSVLKFAKFSVQLVMRFDYPSNRCWTVMIDPNIVGLFKGRYSIWLDLEVRLSLPEGLATWLYGYIESQTRLIPQRTELLREMSGSIATERDFQTLLGRALNQLVGHGLIDDGWNIHAGVLRWRKATTPTEGEGHRQLELLYKG